MPRTDWSISNLLAIELIGHLERDRPRRILEVGSGFSTAILAAYAAEHGAEVVTLEHEREYHRLTARGLTSLGLASFVDLRLAPLRSRRFGDNGPYRWYDVSLLGDFDFVFVDGPPKAMGRQGVFFAVEGHLRPGWRMWIDDGLRRHERQCLKLWEQQFPGRFSYSRLDFGKGSKGVFVLTDAGCDRAQQERQAVLGHVGIGVLGGGDRNWWSRARSNVGERLLDSSYVMVAARDGMPIGSLPKFVDDRLPGDSQPFQRRIGRMFKKLSERPGVRYVLYLDDRWSPCTLDEGWLLRALDILERRPDVEQVLLRHQIDGAAEGVQGYASQPFAFTPSLLRAACTTKMMPSRGEGHWRLLPARPAAEPAMLPLRTVELWPGVFRLTDDQAESLATPDPPPRPPELVPALDAGQNRDEADQRSGEPEDEATGHGDRADVLARVACVALVMAALASRDGMSRLLVLAGLVYGLMAEGGLGVRPEAWASMRSAIARVVAWRPAHRRRRWRRRASASSPNSALRVSTTTW